MQPHKAVRDRERRYRSADMTETDYLVKGAGASAMAFVDVMLRETDATFTIVDRRHAPGGHWNDAYPFLRLHQPSAITAFLRVSLTAA